MAGKHHLQTVALLGCGYFQQNKPEPPGLLGLLGLARLAGRQAAIAGFVKETQSSV
jgi:hypothetical protein